MIALVIEEMSWDEKLRKTGRAEDYVVSRQIPAFGGVLQCGTQYIVPGGYRLSP
jgi:hypothetical protein